MARNLCLNSQSEKKSARTFNALFGFISVRASWNCIHRYLHFMTQLETTQTTTKKMINMRNDQFDNEDRREKEKNCLKFYWLSNDCFERVSLQSYRLKSIAKCFDCGLAQRGCQSNIMALCIRLMLGVVCHRITADAKPIEMAKKQENRPAVRKELFLMIHVD